MCLWPGHGPVADGAWQPDNYPMSGSVAANFVAQIASLSLADLESLRHRLNPDITAAEIERQGELAALARFAGAGEKIDALEAGRIQAQKVLLWRWHLEGCLAEIAGLEARCDRAEQTIKDCLHGEKALEKAAVSQPGFNPMPWRSLVANALFFIPAAFPLLAEAEMALDLQENLVFSEDFRLGETAFRAAHAPLWQALDLSKPVEGAAAAVYNEPRTWLVAGVGRNTPAD